MRILEIQPLPTIKRLINGQLTGPPPPVPVMGRMMMGEMIMGDIAMPVTNESPVCGTELLPTSG